MEGGAEAPVEPAAPMQPPALAVDSVLRAAATDVDREAYERAVGADVDGMLVLGTVVRLPTSAAVGAVRWNCIGLRSVSLVVAKGCVAAAHTD